MPCAPIPCDSILDAIGGTPVVRLCRVVPPSAADVLVKLELLSPNGSLKDRLAAALIDAGEASGALRPGMTVIEASSGNTALAMAMVCRLKRYPMCAVLPDHVPLEFRQALKGYGARIELTPAEEGIGGAIACARQLATELENSWYAGQFEMEAARADDTLSGELIQSAQFDGGRLDAVVMGAGTGAALGALARNVTGAFPEAKVIAVEPARSSVISGGYPSLHRLFGFSMGVRPPLVEPGQIHRVVRVSDEESRAMIVRLGREEGLLVGYSTGACVVAAIQIARELGPGSRVYTVACDTGERYFSAAGWFA